MCILDFGKSEQLTRQHLPGALYQLSTPNAVYSLLLGVPCICNFSTCVHTQYFLICQTTEPRRERRVFTATTARRRRQHYNFVFIKFIGKLLVCMHGETVLVGRTPCSPHEHKNKQTPTENCEICLRHTMQQSVEKVHEVN